MCRFVIMAFALYISACGSGGDSSGAVNKSEGSTCIYRLSNSTAVENISSSKNYTIFPDDNIWAQYGFSSGLSVPNGSYLCGFEKDGAMTHGWKDVSNTGYNDYVGILGSELSGSIVEQGVMDAAMFSDESAVKALLRDGKAEIYYYIYSHNGSNYRAIVLHAKDTFIYEGQTVYKDHLILIISPTVAGGAVDNKCVPLTAQQVVDSGGIPIESAAGLADIKTDLSNNYVLVADIKLSGSGWLPLGDHMNPFTGTFDGNCYKISDLKISGSDYAGLFGVAGAGSELRNIALENVDITGGFSAGGIAGQSIESDISRSYVTGRITGYIEIGGIAGSMFGGRIKDTYSTVNITASMSGGAAGGIVGQAVIFEISNSYSTATIDAFTAGGLVGRADGGEINSCVSINTSISSIEPAGSIVGFSSSAVLAILML